MGRAKVQNQPKMLQSTTKQASWPLHAFALLIKFQMSNVLQICPTLKNMHHHASHNPQTNKKDQRSKTYLAEISKLSTKCMVHHDAASGESCRIYIPPKRPKNLVVIILLLALCSHMATTNYNKRLNLNMFFSAKRQQADNSQHMPTLGRSCHRTQCRRARLSLRAPTMPSAIFGLPSQHAGQD